MMQQGSPSQPIEMFCCYARDDLGLFRKLEEHLAALKREGLATLWADVYMSAGTAWEETIHHHLETARIVLLLISPAFLNSDACFAEMGRALAREQRGEARVIPILLRPVNWQQTPFSRLQLLPSGAKPVESSAWPNRDEAMEQVTKSIRQVIADLQTQQKVTRPTPRSTATPLPTAQVRVISATVLASSQLAKKPGLFSRKTALWLLAAVLLLVLSGILFHASIPSGAAHAHIPSLKTVTAPTVASSTVARATSTAISSAGATATATAQAGAPYGGALLFSDPMSGPDSPFNWETGSDGSGDICNFNAGEYQVTGKCISYGADDNNTPGILPPQFAFEIHLVAGQACGGMMIEGVPVLVNFYLTICQNGAYDLAADENYQSEDKSGIASQAMHTSLGQSNIIGITADGSHLTLYINYTKIVSMPAASFTSSGSVALYGYNRLSGSTTAEVIYTDARVWSL